MPENSKIVLLALMVGICYHVIEDRSMCNEINRIPHLAFPGISLFFMLFVSMDPGRFVLQSSKVNSVFSWKLKLALRMERTPTQSAEWGEEWRGAKGCKTIAEQKQCVTEGWPFLQAQRRCSCPHSCPFDSIISRCSRRFPIPSIYIQNCQRLCCPVHGKPQLPGNNHLWKELSINDS